MENKNIKVSFYQNTYYKSNTITTLESIFYDIKNGKWKDNYPKDREISGLSALSSNFLLTIFPK
jgi:hypothetical protein